LHADEVKAEVISTADALKLLNERAADTNAILHVTCEADAQ